MVKSGLAYNYCIFPNLKYCAQLARDLKQVMSDKVLGAMYRDSSLQVPYVWRREQRKTPPDKFVGNLFEPFDVHEPNYIDQVPVADRIFFLKEEDIKLPYHFVSQ
jgi:hypothetical protein